MRKHYPLLGIWAASVLSLPPQARAQALLKLALDVKVSEPAMVAVPACPIVDAGKSTKELQIDYFPSRPGAAIRDPHSLTLRLVFNTPNTLHSDRTISFNRQKDGSWRAIVPLLPRHNYAIWYVRDSSTGQRDDNNGRYWDLVFCDQAGKKLNDGIHAQAEGYAGAIFSDDLKRSADYQRALSILAANIDIADRRSSRLVCDEWVYKFRLHSSQRAAPPELVQEIEKGLSQHPDAVGYVDGTANFLVNWQQAFPPALVEKAANLADRVVPGARAVSDLERGRAEDLQDPHARAQALGQWLTNNPNDRLYANYVRKERLETFGDLLEVDSAEACFHDLTKRIPYDADIYATMASIYIRSAAAGPRADLGQALILLDNAGEHLRSPRYREGLDYAITLDEDVGRNKAILGFWRGRALFEEAKWNEAESFLIRAAPALSPSRLSTEAYVFLGRAQEQQQEWSRAKSTYLEASLRSPEAVDKFVELSLKTGTPSRNAALKELAGAQKQSFDAARYEPALVDLPAPDFALTTVSGKQITTSSLRGQTVVLDVWATWCGPCVAELSGFAHMKRAHPEVKLLLAAMDSTVPEIENVSRRYGLAPEDIALIDDPNAAKLGLNGVPQTYLIDKTGRIRVLHSGELPDVVSFLESDLDALKKVSGR
jgi:thiol-disulfide isomerase/thioredoxin